MLIKCKTCAVLTSAASGRCVSCDPSNWLNAICIPEAIAKANGWKLGERIPLDETELY